MKYKAYKTKKVTRKVTKKNQLLTMSNYITSKKNKQTVMTLQHITSKKNNQTLIRLQYIISKSTFSHNTMQITQTLRSKIYMKRSRPYYYKYDFISMIGILLSFGLLCLTPKASVICVIARPKSPVRIFIRYLLRSGARKIGEPLAQNVNRSRSVLATDKFGEKSRFSTGVIIVDQRRNASTIGYFDKSSRHGVGTSSPNGKVQHHTIVDDAVRNSPDASHSRNCLTTKPNCHEVDSRVTQVGFLAKKLMNGQEGTQLISWQDHQPHVEHSDMEQFTPVRPTTPEEHESFQKDLHGKTENPIYLNATVNLKNRFNAGTTEKKEPVDNVNKKKQEPLDNHNKEIKAKNKNDNET